ncbi:MAG: DUF452 family protein [Victivallaceae bacterium]|nr:DUF452 family protein [Victivallaceae bacterium]
MKKLWIKRQNSAALSVFFNGWGMDERPFSHLKPGAGTDLLMIYDYTEPDNGGELRRIMTGYDTVHLTAWSLGVFAAAQALAGMNFASATAINGTLKPRDAEEGIPPAIFQGTIASWNEAARVKFNRRMGGVQYGRQFAAASPARSTADQRTELTALQERIVGSPVPANIFHQAIIGLNDKIFTRRAQEKHWTRARIPIRIITEPHYFFSALKSWDELIVRIHHPG